MPPTNSRGPMAIPCDHNTTSLSQLQNHQLLHFDFKIMPLQQLLYPPSPVCVAIHRVIQTNKKPKENKQSVPNDCGLAGCKTLWNVFNVVSSFISTLFIGRLQDHLQPLFAVSEPVVFRFPWALDLAMSSVGLGVPFANIDVDLEINPHSPKKWPNINQ